MALLSGTSARRDYRNGSVFGVSVFDFIDEGRGGATVDQSVGQPTRVHFLVVSSHFANRKEILGKSERRVVRRTSVSLKLLK